jgi:monoamine oxidase
MDAWRSDVLVLGAGAAGLAAVDELCCPRRSVLLLEGRTRIGGRVWTRRRRGLAVPLELGAEFIHGEAEPTRALLRGGDAFIDVPAAHWMRRGGRLQPVDDVFPRIQRAMEPARALRRDVSFSAWVTRRPRAFAGLTGLFARMLVQGFDAADPERVSAASIGEGWSSGSGADAPLFRPLGGYGPLLARLARDLRRRGARLELGAAVRAVRWRRGHVEVLGVQRGRPFRAVAPRAVVTLPLGVLQLPPEAEGAVRFEPVLREKQRALGLLAMGPVVKLALTFRTAFWEQREHGRFRDAAFFHDPGADFPTFWTALPVREPLLVAWAGGPRASQLAGATRAELARAALDGLRRIFGPRLPVAAQFLSVDAHDWVADPFARGAYSYVLTGGRAARDALARPLQDTLFFAGEATDGSGHAATVEGALVSGTRAARAVQRAERRGS